MPDATSAATSAMVPLVRGNGSGQDTPFGRGCLAARRLVQRGVRFVELIDTGSSGNWDSHGDMGAHAPLARNVDQPIAALLADLRGRLEQRLELGIPDALRHWGRAAAAALNLRPYLSVGKRLQADTHLVLLPLLRHVALVVAVLQIVGPKRFDSRPQRFARFGDGYSR